MNVRDDLPSSYLDLLAGIESCITSQAEAICLAELPGSFPPEPLEMAARTAYERGISVITAAGNGAPGPDPDMALAQEPWVMAVAAGPGETGAASGALIAAARVARCVACLRVCLRLTVGNLTDQQRGQWGPLSAPLRFPLIGLLGGAIDLSVFPPPGPNAAYHLSQETTQVRVSRGEQERDWYAAVVSALREAGVALSLSAGPESVHRALALMAQPRPRDPPPHGPGDWGISSLSGQEADSFLSSLVPSRWLPIFSAEALQRFDAKEIDRLDAELGPLWPEAQAGVLTDLFLSGARFLMP